MMPDYAACTRRDCDRRGTCARYLMQHGHWQTVGHFEPPDCGAHFPAERAPFRLRSLAEADDASDSPTPTEPP
jgi:hypothetical protein